MISNNKFRNKIQLSLPETLSGTEKGELSDVGVLLDDATDTAGNESLDSSFSVAGFSPTGSEAGFWVCKAVESHVEDVAAGAFVRTAAGAWGWLTDFSAFFADVSDI